MTDGRPAKRSLSDRLAGMSFMKRREERDKREMYAKRQKRREEAAHWTASQPSPSADALEAPLVIVENGYGVEEPLQTLGRQSFGRFNASLERRNEARLAGVADHVARSAPLIEQAAVSKFAELRERQGQRRLQQDAPEFMLPAIAPAPVPDDPAPAMPVLPAPEPAAQRGVNLGVRHVIAKVRQRVNGPAADGSGKDSSRRKRRHKKR